MRSLVFALTAVLSCSSMLLADDAPPETKDMQVLFNGKDLTGWDGNPELWTVKEGVIHGETTEEKKADGNTFLIWKDGVTKDFELRLSFRCNATNNSGIQYRSKHITEGKTGNAWVVRGYQHELRNESQLPHVARKFRGSQGLVERLFRLVHVDLDRPEHEPVRRL